MSFAQRRAQEAPSAKTTLVLLSMGICSFSMLQTLIVPVLPRLQERLETDQATITWVLTGNLLAASVCTPLLGRLGDSWGKTRALLAALLCLAAGAVLAASVVDVRVLLVARVVQGAGGAVVPLSFGILRDLMPAEGSTERALAVLASLTAGGLAAGLVVAGPVWEFAGYRGLLALPLLTTLPTAVLVWLLLPDVKHQGAGRPPVAAAVLLAAALLGLLVAVSQASRWDVSSTLVWAVAGLVAGAAWLRVEARADVPLVDLSMLRIRGQWTCNMVVGLVGFCLFAAFAFVPQLLQTPVSSGYGMGASIGGSGLLMLPWALATLLVGFVTAPLAARIGSRAVMASGCLLTGVSFLGLALGHHEGWQVCIWTSLQGAGAGVVAGAMAGVVVRTAPQHQTGAASGVNANIRSVGGALGAAVMGSIVASQTGPSGFPAERGYVVGFLVLAGVMVLAAIASAFVPGKPAGEAWPPGAALLDAELGMVPGAGSRTAPPVGPPVRPARRPGTRSDHPSRRR